MENIEPSKVFDSPYYIINKRLLVFIGLWPNLSRVRKNTSLAVFTMIYFSLIIPLFAGITNSKNASMLEVVENCAGILYFTSIYSKYVSAYLFQDRIELVYQQTITNWRNLTDEDELRILHKYSRQGRLLTIIVVGYAIVALCVFGSFPYIPFALDKLMPLENGMWERHHPYHPNYFVIDSQQYFFELFAFHGIYVMVVCTLAAVAIDTMMVSNIIHACGLFAVVCHRLENIGKLLPKPNEVSGAGQSKFIEDHDVYQRCKSVCELHLSSIKSVDMIQNSFSVSFLVQMSASVVGIGMLMFDFLYSLEKKELLRLLYLFVLLLAINIALFYLNWVAQQVMNSSEQVFQYAYYSEWYNLSVGSRKLICIILQNSVKPITLSAASLCDLNLETFASVLKTSMSYATVMLSMQRRE